MISCDSDYWLLRDATLMLSWMGMERRDMDAMQQMVSQSDVSRAMVDEKLGVLADSIERLTHRMSEANPVNTALLQVANGQERLISTLEARNESLMREVRELVLRCIEEL